MSNIDVIKNKLNHWFTEAEGAYVSVDGQFGSTGKGVINALMAEMFADRVNVVTTNAGPNSGHTSWFGDEKIVLKQLPTFGVVAAKMAAHDNTLLPPDIIINSGAIIDENLLREEIMTHLRDTEAWVEVEGRAAKITEEIRSQDRRNVAHIASTGQGVGPALIKKLERHEQNVIAAENPKILKRGVIYVEASQGFSLGINQPFYPCVTTRECTVAQALADAEIAPQRLRKVVMSVRTYPIRVGNTTGSSGDWYYDQQEVSFEQIDQPTEFTTVTGRPRRIATWSAVQFEEAVMANMPDVVFLNFVNYLQPGKVNDFVFDKVYLPYTRLMGKAPEAVLLGYGPRSKDVHLWEHGEV